MEGTVTAAQLLGQVLDRIARWDDPALWIARVDERAVRERAEALDAYARSEPEQTAKLPLFGIPFAVKDNIDVAGMPTTAACPAFAYTPARSAAVVERLVAAGAVLVGKTNLDQFATGLVGTRSPFGMPRNPFDARYIPGGSSSGSAVAVAAGLVSFALGTDTAGSGRVPAAFNNLVGLKPTRGLLSTHGVVPACRSLDCVSVFALTAADAAAVFEVAAGFDPDDPLSRPRPAEARETFGPCFRFGVPAARDLEFFGDHQAEALFETAIATMEKSGGSAAEIRFAPFRDAGALLYDGPWVAERLACDRTAAERKIPRQLLPVTRAIIERGRSYSALDAFRAQYQLAALRREAERELATVDCLLLPTTGTIYEIAAVAADPVSLNSNLGLYTNFANLLDLSAVALPAGFRSNGLPFGISLAGAGLCRAPAARPRNPFQSLGGSAAAIEAAELGAEIAGEGVHRRTAGAGFGVRVVVGVGVDVIGIDRAKGVGDELDAGDADVVAGKKLLETVLQRGVDVFDDREFGARLFSGGAESIADGADIGRAQLEAVAGIDLDRVHEPAADELGASDQRCRGGDVLLQEMQAVDRRLVIRAVEVVAERSRAEEQPHAEPLAAAVRLEDERAVAEMLPRRLDEQLLAGNEHSPRRANAGVFEGSVLARLADLEVERAAAVDGAAPVAFEPSQHRGGQFGCVAMVPGVRRSTHSVVEDALWRRLRQIEDAAIEEPIAPQQPLSIERARQRLKPGGIFVNYVDVGHRCLIAQPP